jgi:hypothetical protein
VEQTPAQLVNFLWRQFCHSSRLLLL